MANDLKMTQHYQSGHNIEEIEIGIEELPVTKLGGLFWWQKQSLKFYPVFVPMVFTNAESVVIGRTIQIRTGDLYHVKVAL